MKWNHISCCCFVAVVVVVLNPPSFPPFPFFFFSFTLVNFLGAHVNVYGWGTRSASTSEGSFYNDLDYRTGK